jgi:transposase
MARAYSDDLRSKILRAYEHGRQGLEAIAEQFGVSYGYTKKIRRQQLQSGRVERSLQARHGPISRVTPEIEEQLRRQLRRQPDGSAGRACGRCCNGWNCGVKKIPPRERAGQPPGATMAPSLVGNGKPDRSGTAGVSEQEGCDHGNDAPLRPGRRWPARPRCGARWALAYTDGPGGSQLTRYTSRDDGRGAH